MFIYITQMTDYSGNVTRSSAYKLAPDSGGRCITRNYVPM